jgi:4-amino-4-deoxy-L-arabinose transferase-like glycosyltransferase
VILVLTLAPVLCEALLSRDRAQLRAPFAPRRLALFAVIALPWYLVASARTPGLFAWFLGKRVTGALTSSEGFHSGSFFYYLPVCLLGFLPASALLCTVGRDGWRELMSERRLRLLACAVLFPLVVLSLSASKLVTYVLPLAVPTAVLAANALERGLVRRGLLVASATFALLVAALAMAGAVRGTFAALPRAANAYFAAAGLFAVLGSLGAFLLARRRRLTASCRWLVAAQLTALLACVPAVALAEPQLARSGSGRDAARALGALADEGRTLLCYRCFVRSLPFYTGKRIVLADFESDVGYERSLSEAVLKGPEALRAMLARGPAAILCRTKHVDELLRAASPLTTVSTSGKYTILVNDPAAVASDAAARE